jgi:hypothetical protein
MAPSPSTLLRGCRGSDWGIGRHGPGAVFVLLSDAETKAIALDLGDLDATRYARTVGRFDVFDTAAVRSRIARGEAERPWSPVHVRGTRDGSGNLTIAWRRRTRIGGHLAWRRPDVEPPLGEASEAYEVEIIDGSGEVVRTIARLTAPSASYARRSRWPTSVLRWPQSPSASTSSRLRSGAGTRGRPPSRSTACQRQRTSPCRTSRRGRAGPMSSTTTASTRSTRR